MVRRLLVLMMLGCAVSVCPAQSGAESADLSSMLSLFSAHAANGAVRLNWSLDTQSPALVKFRVYRGYEEVGNFAVLTEISSNSRTDSADYSYNDTEVRESVSYFYKISSLTQSSESIFPVVISATPTRDADSVAKSLPPVALLSGQQITLYVRKPGHVRLELRSDAPRVLVDEELRPGIYEFEPPHAPGARTRLRATHDSDYFTETEWPMK
ncbi:hypothetical protein HZB60_02045 [candidate division KSB1 bacterium]|nr:hypothetical protein [candidate division KSB1 bacterium]